MDCHNKILGPRFPESNYPSLLKWLRFVFFPLNTGLFLFFMSYSPSKFFVFFTNWGIFLTFVYFFITSLSYQSKFLQPFCYVLFEVVWPLNVVITIMFWCYIFPFTYQHSYIAPVVAAHVIPMVSTLTDFLLNKIVFIRVHYYYPAIIILGYGLLVLLPYTLISGEVYPGVNFVNYISYVVFFAAFIILFGALEIGRFIKIRICKNSFDEENRENVNNNIYG